MLKKSYLINWGIIGGASLVLAACNHSAEKPVEQAQVVAHTQGLTLYSVSQTPIYI